MSLVHQALRKAEQEKHRKTGVASISVAPVQVVVSPPRPAVVPAPVVPVPVALSLPAPKSHSWLLPVALIAIAAVAIVAIVVLVLRTAPLQPTVTAESGGRGVPAVTGTVSEPPAANRGGDAAPTEPPPPSPTESSPFKLTGISKDPAGNYLAIINGNLRGVNEYVDGAVIKKIERDRVTLEVNGREAVVRLF